MSAEKVDRMMFRVISSSGAGTTCTTSFSGVPRMSASRGDTTVVLPAPMIIWWHRLSCALPSDAPRNSRTSSICDLRSMMLDTNSNRRKRGSYVSCALPLPLSLLLYSRRARKSSAIEVHLSDKPWTSALAAAAEDPWMLLISARISRALTMQRAVWPARLNNNRAAASRCCELVTSSSVRERFMSVKILPAASSSRDETA
mmetsp:Transcript_88232/g.234615  ORF Transcript_88232/g.234615 Transcript_88232/m.234615 type:complete len:201 (+) Transcript_88232:85-687(+)